MQNTWKKIGKIALIVLASLLALFLLVRGGLNISKFVIYGEYYSIESRVCANPGLSDGFVCQGIAAYEKANKIFVSGYMKDHSASRIYVTDPDSNSYYVSLSINGKSYTGHAGGIAWHGDNVYVASDDALYVLPIDALLNAKNGDTIAFVDKIPVNNQASFVYADENYIYVGEFHDGGQYVTNHPYETPDGLYHAIVSRYPANDLSKPDKVYSIRNKVQGICFTPDGRVVLSTSYGLADSVYYVYNEKDAIDSGLTLDGAPVYYLNGCVKEIKGPAMAEELDWYNGKIITLTESASDKYIFGKFFFANDIVTLDIK